MRRPLVAGNWKMFKTSAEARVLLSELLPGLTAIQGVEIVLCPPFTSILTGSSLIRRNIRSELERKICIGKHQVHTQVKIAPPMVAEFCKYVIIGHSERRAYFGETDKTVNLKVKAAFETWSRTHHVCR